MRKWVMWLGVMCGVSVSAHTGQGETYPVVIIGSGVASLTAATYLGRGGVVPLVIEGPTPGGAITQSERIENWPGEISISGSALADKMREQAKENGTLFLKEKVVAVDLSKSPFKITTQSLFGEEKREFLAQTCILALGSLPNRLQVPGENTYWLKGVYSCAVCDGSLYKDQVVAIVGGGDAAFVDAQYLAGLAKKVYLIVRGSQLRAQEKARVESVLKHPKITILYHTTVTEILGDQHKVEALALHNTKNGQDEKLPVDALFIKIGSKPNTELFQGQLALNADGYIVLGEEQKTSVPGVFAAGDIADFQFQQAVCAAGDGARAAMSAQRYLADQVSRKPSESGSKTASAIVEVNTCKDLMALVEKSQQRLTFIDFYSTRCPPCRVFAPYYEGWAQRFWSHVNFIKVNADTGGELFRAYQIRGVPTLVILDQQGREITRKTGLPEISEIGQKLEMCQTGAVVDPLLFRTPSIN